MRNAYFFDDQDDLEIQIDLIMQEMARRERLLGDQYLFSSDDNRLSIREHAFALPYTFLLLISTSEPFRSGSRYVEIDEMFDELVASALRSYLGSNSRSVRFGWPPSGDRPSGFSEAMDWLGEQMILPRGPAWRRPEKNDGGVDIIAWRPFRDERTGYLAILCQCTVAFEWDPKGRDIVEDVWLGWLDFGKRPATSLAIPFVVQDQYPKWDEIRRTVNMLLDRLRICELLDELNGELAENIISWSENELERMRDR